MPRLVKEWYALCVARRLAREARKANGSVNSKEQKAWGEAYHAFKDAVKAQGLELRMTGSNGGDYDYMTSDGEQYRSDQPL